MKNCIALRMLLCALIFGVGLSAPLTAQQYSAPDLRGKRPVFHPKHDPAGTEFMPVHGHFPEMQIPLEPLASDRSTHRAALTKTAVPVGQYEIGVMANTWCMIGENRCQIAHDPHSGTTAVVFRGNDRSSNGDGNTLYIRYSDDGGGTWSAQGENVAVSPNPRYPNIFLPNTGSAAHTALTWAQVVQFGDGTEGFGDVHSMKAGIGGTAPSYAQLATPPNWDVPSRIVMDQTNGDLYCMSEAIEPANGDYTGEVMLLRSTDGGQQWQYVSLDHQVFTDDLIPDGYFATNLRLDLSPDASTMIAAVAFIKESEPGLANILDDDHEIAWRISTDHGATWGSLQRLRLSDIPGPPQPFDAKLHMSWDLDVVLDHLNRPHFLTVCSADLNPFDPWAEAPTDSTISLIHIDSTFVTEITSAEDEGWRIIPIGPARRVRIDRISFTAGRDDDAPMVFRNEPKWARDWEGTRIYAQWISPLRSWTVANVAGQPTLFQDTITQIYVNGRHVDKSTAEPYARSWDFRYPDHNTVAMDSLMRVTALTDVAAKYTKMAYYAGNLHELHIIYVEWGVGETLDDDPVLSDQIVWYVQEVQFPPMLMDVEQLDPTPGSFVLKQNYPNPFNPSTVLEFTLSGMAHVSLRVYDMLGREIAVLADASMRAGTHRATFDAAGLPGGMYIARLESGGKTETRKMMLVK